MRELVYGCNFFNYINRHFITEWFAFTEFTSVQVNNFGNSRIVYIIPDLCYYHVKLLSFQCNVFVQTSFASAVDLAISTFNLC